MKDSYIQNSLFSLQQIAETITAIGSLNSALSNSLNDEVAVEHMPTFIDEVTVERLATVNQYLGELISLKADDLRNSQLLGGEYE